MELSSSGGMASYAKTRPKSMLGSFGELWSSDEEEEEISFLFLINSSLEIHGTKGVMWSTPTIGAYWSIRIPVTQDLLQWRAPVYLEIIQQQQQHEEHRLKTRSYSGTACLLEPVGSRSRQLTDASVRSSRTTPGDRHPWSTFLPGTRRGASPKTNLEEPGRTCENSQHYYMLEATVRYFYKPLDLSSALHNVTPAACMAMCIKNCSCKVVLSQEKTSTCFQMNEVFALNRTRNVADQASLFSIKLYQAGDLPKLSAPGSSQNKEAKQQKKAKPAIVGAFSVATMAIIIIAMVIWKKLINSYLKHYKPSFPSGAMDVVRVRLHVPGAPHSFSKKIALARQDGRARRSKRCHDHDPRNTRIHEMRVSDKLDVYSFGILVLQMATGLQAFCLAGGKVPGGMGV
ncbi:hypothetical protein SELMODRAFT_404109 [Selaginella moellendorffii]|uniref:Apple domain-containing protein n=1 Tax=Selaginella moellendorffii TaxID=88036 RepID=D8QUB1_SELML|nr:hypothetical protein SELMODRAFT_404109 [Selaginella moellendorffii]